MLGNSLFRFIQFYFSINKYTCVPIYTFIIFCLFTFNYISIINYPAGISRAPVCPEINQSNSGTTPTLSSLMLVSRITHSPQLIYLREDKTTPGKRGRRGDKLLHVSSTDTVQDVKVQICRKMAIAPSEQTLRLGFVCIIYQMHRKSRHDFPDQ